MQWKDEGREMSNKWFWISGKQEDEGEKGGNSFLNAIQSYLRNTQSNEQVQVT